MARVAVRKKEELPRPREPRVKSEGKFWLDLRVGLDELLERRARSDFWRRRAGARAFGFSVFTGCGRKSFAGTTAALTLQISRGKRAGARILWIFGLHRVRPEARSGLKQRRVED